MKILFFNLSETRKSHVKAHSMQAFSLFSRCDFWSTLFWENLWKIHL